MSVSSHLTPEPERRLWLILESMGSELRWIEAKLAGLAALASAELITVAFAAPRGPMHMGSVAGLALVAAAGLVALLPLSRSRALAFLDERGAKPASGDIMLVSDDIVKYSRGELILKLDRYLGGGVTATQYYEDLVAQILAQARGAARKRRLLRGFICLTAAVQLLLAASFL